MTPRTALLTAVAMVAFATNSLLCRAALGAERIDAASFASVRVISGAVALLVILALRDRRPALPFPAGGETRVRPSSAVRLLFMTRQKPPQNRRIHHEPRQRLPL